MARLRTIRLTLTRSLRRRLAARARVTHQSISTVIARAVAAEIKRAERPARSGAMGRR